jgi:hypothetical protein
MTTDSPATVLAADTLFGADLTIMEEGTELLHRLKQHLLQVCPMLVSSQSSLITCLNLAMAVSQCSMLSAAGVCLAFGFQCWCLLAADMCLVVHMTL